MLKRFAPFGLANFLCLKQASKRALCEESKQKNGDGKKEGDELDDLDKIFQENPFAASDPEELEEILAARNKKAAQKPPQFARLILPVKMLTHFEQNDGLKFEFSLPVSAKFQTGFMWSFSNTKPGNFTLMTMLTSAPMTQSLDNLNYINAKKDTNGRLEYQANYKILPSLSLKTEGFFPNENIAQSHLNFELVKEFSDCLLSLKMSEGTHTVGMMQSISQGLHAGFEAMWHPMQHEYVFNYGAKYVTGPHTLIAQYVPLAKKDAFTMGYIAKPSNKVSLVGELRASPDGFSETTMGFRIRFNSGSVGGYFSSAFKATTQTQMLINSFMMASFYGQVDFARPEKPPVFGVSISFGGGM